MKTPEQIALHSRLAAVVITVVFAALMIAFCTMAQAAPASQELVQRGAYLARAGDCIACHTAREGQPFAGGLPLNTPIGIIYSTNITPDLETGIGRYSRDDFEKVMREGVAKDGHHLYPAMPYTSYARLTQEDLSALYAWFTQGVEPVHNPNRRTRLSWPLSMRSLMAVWNGLYFKKGEYAVDPDKSAEWNRGAYLVQGLGHCGDCHTPRGIAGQVKAVSERDGGRYLAGATLDNWYASPLAGDLETGLKAWPKDEIVEFLRTGRTARVAAIGIMSEVVGKSTQYLTDPDLMAIAEYLKSLPPSFNEGQGNADSAMQASEESAATRALRAGDTGIPGSRDYLDNCNACHRSDGSGAKRTFPNLVKNEVVNASDPTSLIHLVLAGSSMPSTQTAPSALAMPDFGWRLSDEEVADVLSFVRGSWGNHAAGVSRDEVGRVRKSLAIQKTVR
ncbi:MAG: cytochrome c [Desulfuromonadales bacterium]|nr:cytochrome c [Desulfuromonadales bacterium]